MVHCGPTGIAGCESHAAIDSLSPSFSLVQSVFGACVARHCLKLGFDTRCCSVPVALGPNSCSPVKPLTRYQRGSWIKAWGMVCDKAHTHQPSDIALRMIAMALVLRWCRHGWFQPFVCSTVLCTCLVHRACSGSYKKTTSNRYSMRA